MTSKIPLNHYYVIVVHRNFVKTLLQYSYFSILLLLGIDYATKVHTLFLSKKQYIFFSLQIFIVLMTFTLPIRICLELNKVKGKLCGELLLNAFNN